MSQTIPNISAIGIHTYLYSRFVCLLENSEKGLTIMGPSPLGGRGRFASKKEACIHSLRHNRTLQAFY
jgi:hypothetical protein